MKRPLFAILTITALGQAASDTTGNWLTEAGTGCTGSYLALTDSTELQPKTNQGGYWFAYTDSAGVGIDSGSSRLVEDTGTWMGIRYLPQSGAQIGMAQITAKLDKGSATLHPDGGWAIFGTQFHSSEMEPIAYDMTGLKAISFHIDFDKDFDTTTLAGVEFQALQAGVPESSPFQAGIKPSFRNRTAVCIDLGQFKRSGDASSTLSTQGIYGIRWKLAIRNSAERASQSSISIGDVRFWGPEKSFHAECLRLGTQKLSCEEWGPSLPYTLLSAPPSAIGSSNGNAKGASHSQISARYAHGLLLSYDLGNGLANVEIRSLDGRLAQAFQAPARAENVLAPVSLRAGTWLVTASAHGTSRSALLSIAR